MEDREIRAALDRHWAASDVDDFEAEHQICQEDAVLEYPQSGERIRAVRRIIGDAFRLLQALTTNQSSGLHEPAPAPRPARAASPQEARGRPSPIVFRLSLRSTAFFPGPCPSPRS